MTDSIIKKPKNIIFVDASSLRGRYKIGLYDKTNNIKHTLKLGKLVRDINNAETCAILYGLMYIQKSNNQNRHILMNDSEGATTNIKLLELGGLLNTNIIWIPREINKADKVAKSKANKKKKVWRNLNFFMKLVLGNSIFTRPEKLQTEKSLEEMTPVAKAVLEEILKQKAHFPMTTAEFPSIVTTAYTKTKATIKKGDMQKVRKELCDNNILTVKDKVIILNNP